MKKVIVAAMLIFGLMVGIVNADVIPLVKGARGNYDIFVTFSDGSRASFLLDTGATTTCLSPETFIRLTSSGKVSMTFLGEGQATLADNSKVTTSHWTLGQVSLSPTVVVRNLEVMIAPSGGSNLLGMNFLSQMGTWSINSSNSTLITGQQTTPPPPSQRQLPPHVEVVDNEGHIRPVKGYIWVDPSSPGSEVIPIPANIDSTSPIYPYDYRPAKGYRWIDSSKPMTGVVPMPANVITLSLAHPYQYSPAPGYRWVNPSDIQGSRFAVVAIPSAPVVVAQTVTPITPIPFEEAGVIPHQRVYNFALGMTKKEVMKLGKPQDQITSGLEPGVQLWKYVNKTTGNILKVYFKQEQVFLVCFTSPKFFTAEGITTVNFDTPNAMLTHVSGPHESFDFTEGGLFYLVATREGCVIK